MFPCQQIKNHSFSQTKFGYLKNNLYFCKRNVLLNPKDMKKFIITSLFIFSLNAIAQNSDYQIGVNYYDKGDYKNAYTYLLKSANNGNMYAQTLLGNMYGFALGVDLDYTKAFEWFGKAANQGYADAQCKLGELYEIGYGVKQDYSKAFEWHLKSAEKGNLHSQYKIGCYYYSGKGITKDLQKAEFWSKKAIESDKGYPFPYSVLALIYAERDKDYSEALHFSDLAISNVGDYSPLDLYGERGQIYVCKGDMENAEKMLAKCLELNPDYLKGDEEFAKMMLAYHNNEVDTKVINNPTINKNTFAIVIGNEKYRNEVDVPFAQNDAKIFCEYVKKTLGVPHDQIRHIENAGYNDLRIAINWLVQAMLVCRGKGKAIVYYAGHGIPNESDQSSYLLPVDGIGNDSGSAYALQELYDKLGNVEAQSITIFLDACFSGSKREEGTLTSARGVAIKAKQSTPKGNLIVFSAAQGDETAYPYKDKQHGLFTYFLLKKLQETKGEVTLGELSEYLADEVGRQSFIKNNKIQTPTVSVASSLQNSWKSLKLK